jgi:polyhydroxyalkanoate synthase subunit PhaC
MTCWRNSMSKDHASPTPAELMQQWAQLWQSGFSAVWDTYAHWLQAASTTGAGPEVGRTAAAEIWRHGRLRLIRYCPLTPQQYAVPVLCVPSLINRYYILDLLPERSLVAYLVSRGLNVYLLDWGRPRPSDKTVTLDEHVTGYLYQAVAAVAADSAARNGSEQVSLLGYCMGGMFAAVYTSLFGRQIANLVNLAGPIDYHDDGLFSLLTRSEWFDVDYLVDQCGNIPAELMLWTFQMMRPTSHLLRALSLYERLDDPSYVRSFAAMQTWIYDQVDFPGEAFRRYIKELYQQNRLARNQFKIEGERIRLERITCPLLTIASVQDETAPAASVAVLNELAGSPERQMLMLKGPHIGMVAGSRAPDHLWPAMAAWLLNHSGAAVVDGCRSRL